MIDPATGEALNLAMVRAGRRRCIARYCSDPRYTRAEGEARAAGLGIWSREGEQQRPWEWRNR